MSLRKPTYNDAENRVRTALVVLIAGVVLLLAGLTIVLLRAAPVPASRVARHEVPQRAATGDELAAQTAVVLMGVGGVLVVTLLGAGYALFRVTRRLTQPRSGKPFRPTATDDVWKMHKLAKGPPGEQDREP